MLRTLAFIYLCSLLMCGFAGKPQIRVANHGTAVLENVIVRFPAQEEKYGTIPAKGATAYREIEQAYRYAYIEATVQGEKVVLQPIDYVGEQLLGGGKYTYALTYNDKAETKYDRLRFELIRD